MATRIDQSKISLAAFDGQPRIPPIDAKISQISFTQARWYSS